MIDFCLFIEIAWPKLGYSEPNFQPADDATRFSASNYLLDHDFRPIRHGFWVKIPVRGSLSMGIRFQVMFTVPKPVSTQV